MKWVDLSIKRPIGVIMVVLAVLALGFVSLRSLSVDLFPEIELPIAVVATSYVGAGSQEVENLISRPLESSLGSLQGMSSIQSSSQAGSSLIIMQFNTGTNLDNALYQVRERVDMVKGMLPEEAGDPSVLRFDPQQIPIMNLALTGSDLAYLQQVAEDQVVPAFERADDVASVSIAGGQTRELQVELDVARLNQYGITANHVIQALAGENKTASAGVISKGAQDLQIRVDGEFDSTADIENTMISLPTGGHIRIKDVSNLKDIYLDMTSITRVNDSDALMISIMKKSDGNTITAADGLYEAIAQLEEQLPDDIKLTMVIDTSVFIRQSVDSVVNNMFMGGILSILILMLFLRSIRATIVIGVAIPIAIVATFSLMYFTGMTLNIISMSGLALGIGMMVDNSIVILENIYLHRQRGENMMEAARKGASELGSAVIASTTTTVVVFLPIVFVGGIAADLFKPLALTICFSLLASLVVAMTLVPMLSSKLLTKMPGELKPGKRMPLFDRLFNKLTAVYKRMLNWALDHRKSTVWLTVAAIVISLALTPLIGAEFIPGADQGQIQITLETPVGSTISETEDAAEQVMSKVRPYMDNIDVSSLTIGGGGGIPGVAGNANQGTLALLLVKQNERDMTTSELATTIRDDIGEIPGVEVTVAELAGGFPAGSPIQIQIRGQELDVLTELAEQVKWIVSDIPGTANVESSMEQGRPEIQIEVNRDYASQYGLSYQQVINEVNMAFTGRVATRYREEGNEIDVRVIIPEERRSVIRDLETMLIQSSNGSMIPLSQVANLKQVLGPTTITRQDQQRQLNVTGDLDGRDLGSVTDDVTEALATLNMPDGYTYQVGGQAMDMADTFGDLAVALIFAIFLVYVVMAIQFESIVYPFVVMFAMPTTIVGVLGGLFITGTPISVTAIIGMLMLAGIVVNNAIILVDYINTLRDRGESVRDAILEAGPRRLRAILMTTLTTVLAMVPLALAIGEGAEMNAPMAIVVIFGLLCSMFFTLLLIPVMYTYADGFMNRLRRRSKKQQLVEENIISG